ncbi:hypothetical protein Tco_0382616 [Tanacetum coccineum]
MEDHLSSLKELLKQQNNRDLIKPMLLNFNEEIQDNDDEDHGDYRTNGSHKPLKRDRKPGGMTYASLVSYVLADFIRESKGMV